MVRSICESEKFRNVCLCLVAFSFYLPRVALGKVEITNLTFTSNVYVRFANVSVFSSVVNSGTEGQETSFEVWMPVAALITRFSIFVNGEEYIGEIKENEAALTIYNEGKKNNEATGLITKQASVQENFDYEQFKVQVFVPAQSLVEFYLQYQELLERQLGVYSQRIFIRPQQIVPDLNVICYYNEPQGFRNFTYKLPTAGKNEIKVELTDFTRKISYRPSEQSQISVNADVGLDDKLLVEYDVVHDTNGGIIVENEDHFTHFFFTRMPE